jgi:hypothetical protein
MLVAVLFIAHFQWGENPMGQTTLTGSCVAALILFAFTSIASAEVDGDGYEIAVQAGARGAGGFTEATDAEMEAIIDGLQASGSRGASKGKIDLDAKIALGGKSGARGAGFKMSLREMKERYNKLGNKLKKYGTNLRKPGKDGVVQRLKMHRKKLEAAAQRAVKAATPKVKTNKPWRFWRKSKKKGARGAAAATPFDVDARFKLKASKAGARGGKAAKYEKKGSKYPVDFDTKFLAAKVGGSYTLRASAREVMFKADAVANGRLFKKSFSLLETSVMVKADSDKEKVFVSSSAKVLGKTKKLPAWMNKAYPSKFSYDKVAWSKSFDENKPWKFDIVVCKGNGTIWGKGEVGVHVGFDADTLNVSGRVRPYANLKGGIKGTGRCVGNDYGFKGSVTVIDAWVEIGANAGLYEDNQGLYVEAGLYGKYQYKALSGKLSAWWRGWASDFGGAVAKGACKVFGFLAKKKCKKANAKKLKTNRKTFWDNPNGYAGSKNFLSLSKKAYLKGSNPKAAANGRGGSAGGESASDARPKVVVKPRVVVKPNRRPGAKPRIVVKPKRRPGAKAKRRIVVKPKRRPGAKAKRRPGAKRRIVVKPRLSKKACKKACKKSCKKNKGIGKKIRCMSKCKKGCR